MTEQQTRSKQYERARSEFNNLKIEDKAVFLVESAVTTVARGIEEVGKMVADELDALFHEPPPEPEEPEAKKTRSKKRATAPKKTTRTTKSTRTSRKKSDDSDTDEAGS